MGKTQNNENLLMKELKARKVVSVQEAMDILGVSIATVRRLFTRMEEKGLCIKGQGCIHAVDNGFMNIYTYESAENSKSRKKEIIADKALKLIEDGDVIYLDEGTTLAKLSARIADAIRDRKLSNVTVFTNSLINLNLLKNYVQVHIVGGEYRDNRKAFCGLIAEKTVGEICFSKCFVSIDGYTKGAGFTATDFETASLERTVILNSRESYLLADSEKFQKTSMVVFAKEKDITMIVTDDIQELDFLKETGVNIM